MAIDEGVNSSAYLTDIERDALIARMKLAWNALPPDKQAALKPVLDNAHQQFASYLSTGKPPDEHTRPLLGMKSYLTNDWDGHLESLRARAPASAATGEIVAPEAIEIKVGPGGEILGTGKYQELDVRWTLVAGTVWLENLLHRHPFPAGSPKTIAMGDEVTIAIAGDYGTGNFGSGDSPSTKISKFIPSLNPDYTIHLGDVYYAGTSAEEISKLNTFWPRGTKGSFALNSNHEMYSGGDPYFNLAVGGPVFNALQSPYSFFALENSNWIVVGLDSAYNADVLKLYMDGSLGTNAQIPFLKDLATRGKKVIVLTHHNGLPEDGVHTVPPLKLFGEVIGAFAGQRPPAYWYWGHVHAGVVYKPMADQSDMLCRCAGHSALPWGLSSDLEASPNVTWFETRNAADPDDLLRVFNGFVFLQLAGATLKETYYDENGGVAWTSEG
jgi:hypothetical protein